MKRIHIIGGKNHGKTTLITELVQELTTRGYCVGTIKHTHHQHELDAPGKDSHRHREAGATVVGILSRSMNAVFWPTTDDTQSELDNRYDDFDPVFEQCDLVLVEGDSQTTAIKIEVWRNVIGTPPLANQVASVKAIVTDDVIAPDKLDATVPVLARTNISVLANTVLALAKIHDRA